MEAAVSTRSSPTATRVVPPARCISRKEHVVWENYNGMKGSRFGFGQFYLLFTVTVFWDYYVRSSKHTRNRRAVLKMLKTMAVLMWCWHCRNSYAQFHASTQITAQELFTPWLHNLKALVNRKLGKLNLPASYCDALYTQTELAYWKHRQLSPQWIVALWTNLYLTSLSYPSSKDPERLRSFLEASEDLLECITDCIPSVGSRFKTAFAASLAGCQAQRTGNSSASTSSVAAAASPNQHSTKRVFKSRDEMFHFMYNLECDVWAQLRTTHHVTCQAQPIATTSIFGDSCTSVHAYFESIYRAEDHH